MGPPSPSGPAPAAETDVAETETLMIRVLHVETGRHLYGGAQQVVYLLAGLRRHPVQSALVCVPGAAIAGAVRELQLPVFERACGGDLDLAFIARLGSVIRDWRPDLIHLHSRRGADLLGGVAARLAGVPAVLSRRVDNPEARAWARLKYRLYARTIGISAGIVEVLRAAGAPPDRLRVVRSAVDAGPWQTAPARAAMAAEFGLDPSHRWIGVVAQLIERKGHRVLFEALRQLAPAATSLVLFGQGPLRPALEAEAAGLGLPVRFAGFRRDLPHWLGGLDLLVHPAFMEGLGVSLLQASAAGVPILACRAGGIPEAVLDGINGHLVAPGDAPALAEALGRLLADPAARARLAEGGRRLAREQFSTEAMVAGNLAVYRELRP